MQIVCTQKSGRRDLSMLPFDQVLDLGVPQEFALGSRFHAEGMHTCVLHALPFARRHASVGVMKVK